ncbi:hypothetical protein RFI_06907 [Reticulomyxa filosa]|uniref:Pre-mRNA-splicing factor Syf1/CRNKL1-like C-terminal HAT-repeats domain-containing protein n=1 Tax=Reticulomyxa filosa TaxID=46433 RepID=X6NWF3_RETFI|nr:hypothetical protein RFI_06907 [Reticulomyxa filosa]|eukprot:ETO30213.1 hypothetical protein RFI_06907 [Reticulomyxa filosa]
MEKKFWKRYIYLWYKYVIFEELIAKDIERCRKVYQCVIKLIPHDLFTFGKMWIHFAKFEIRQNNLQNARNIFGTAIGKCPKKSIFNQYISIEFQLGEFSRCRQIYNKYIECFMEDCQVWISYAKMEAKLDEYERCKQIYEISISKQEHIDMPEMIWRSYIDFEIQYQHLQNARNLFERLLTHTKHVKVWITYAQFESTIAGVPAHSRAIFQRASDFFEKEFAHADSLLIQERVLLLDAWLQFEQEWGSPEEIDLARSKQPKRIKRKRPIKTEQGIDAGYQEFYDFIFPSDQLFPSGALKLLQHAKSWKQNTSLPSD